MGSKRLLRVELFVATVRTPGRTNAASARDFRNRSSWQFPQRRSDQPPSSTVQIPRAAVRGSHPQYPTPSLFRGARYSGQADLGRYRSQPKQGRRRGLAVSFKACLPPCAVGGTLAANRSAGAGREGDARVTREDGSNIACLIKWVDRL